MFFTFAIINFFLSLLTTMLGLKCIFKPDFNLKKK